MTFFELYRIGIPIFVPSIRLLNRWELQRHVMSERVYWRHAPSPLRMPSSPNPNSLTDQAALEHWLKLSTEEWEEEQRQVNQRLNEWPLERHAAAAASAIARGDAPVTLCEDPSILRI